MAGRTENSYQKFSFGEKEKGKVVETEEKTMRKGSLEEIKQGMENAEQPLITVAVTIYNIKEYVKRSVESVCMQTYKNLEILLVDDGSSDGSEKLCDEYAKKDSRIRVIHKKNSGPADARNTAIEAAKGEYIAFVDGDDWVEPDMYENMYKAIQKAGADLAICSYKQILKEHIEDPSDDTLLFLEKGEALECFIRETEEIRIRNAVWNKLIKKELLKELRFPTGRLYEEIVFTTKLLDRSERAVYLNQGYYNYVTDRAGSIMNVGVNARIFTDQIPLYYEKREYLRSVGREDLVKIHDFYFYKRLLQHYLELKKNKPKDHQKFCRQIVQILKKEKANIPGAYETDISTGNDAFKMKIFRISPKGFYYFTLLNERYVIPQKLVKSSMEEKLVVIQLSGGMGNQMFQYALYLQLKALGKNVKIDDRTKYEKNENARPIRLQVFDLKYPTPSETEMCCLTDSYMDMVSRIRRKLTGRKNAAYVEKSPLFDERVLQMDRAYLEGCWQSEKYFAAVRDRVREAFTFKNLELSEKMQAYEEQIKQKNAVCVHIRRGDYLKVNEVYGDICTPQYYEKAMKQMAEWEPDCHFFIFTNDVVWAKEKYCHPRVTIVEGNDEDAGYLDMYLMIRCRHYILANSSFSWWGCYLNSSKEKRVIAPKKWFQGMDCRDIYTKEMNTCI